MALPINIPELLHGETVEWDRIELKQGWNPEDVIHTICAFANDINNWGGGYIFIGVAEQDGVAVLPPVGIPKASLDKIQRELISLCHQVEPYYAPVTQPYVLDGKHLLAIWVPGGDNRPYKAPTTLGAKGQKRYYVRRGSATVLANDKEEALLLDMAKRIPFDDRVNHHASVGDLDLTLIRLYLSEVKSDLEKEVAKTSLPDLALQMRIAAGPPEALLPLNVGLLFFSEAPYRWFPGAKTEVVFYKGDNPKQFKEQIFLGPLHTQLKRVVSYIDTNIVAEQVIKVSTRPEALRFFNYPLAALEEVVANAFYHRSYEVLNLIEINVRPDRIEVLSFPGPLPPLNKVMLTQKVIVARNYRNRRVGDFFKELKLTEGRSTGFPTIYNSMEKNGSPKPYFETDDDYSYFLAVLPIHPLFIEYKPTAADLQILQLCLRPQKRSVVLSAMGVTNHPANYKRYILPLIERNLIYYTRQNTLSSPKQEYITTEEGRDMLEQNL